MGQSLAREGFGGCRRLQCTANFVQSLDPWPGRAKAGLRGREGHCRSGSKLHTQGGPGRRPALARARQGRRICLQGILDIQIPWAFCITAAPLKRLCLPRSTRKVLESRPGLGVHTLSDSRKVFRCVCPKPSSICDQITFKSHCVH